MLEIAIGSNNFQPTESPIKTPD